MKKVWMLQILEGRTNIFTVENVQKKYGAEIEVKAIERLHHQYDPSLIKTVLEGSASLLYSTPVFLSPEFFL